MLLCDASLTVTVAQFDSLFVIRLLTVHCNEVLASNVTELEVIGVSETELVLIFVDE